MQNIVTSITNEVVGKKLISAADNVLVAFSGGPDSTALLQLLHNLSRRHKFGLAACYVNHNIRPHEARREIKFCAQFCLDRRIPFIIVEGDVPAFAREKRLSMEEAGRMFRYTLLEKIARENGFNKIAVAHHQDDVIETILFRLFRGTGPAGLDPIKPLMGRVIRPLLRVSRVEIMTYLRKHRLPYVIDRSNLKSNYSRNYIRNKIIPVVEKHFGAKYRSAILNFAQIASEQEAFLRRYVEKQLKAIITATPGGKIILDLNRFSLYDDSLKRLMIKLTLEELTGSKGAGTFQDVTRVQALMTGKVKAVEVSSRVRIRRERENLILARDKVELRRRDVRVPGKVSLPEIRSDLRSRLIPLSGARKGIQKKGLKINIDSDKLLPPFYLRGVLPGDSFTPLGMRGTKKVGDYLTDRKISRFIRDEIPVMLDQSGIVWVVGHQIAERVKIGPKTRKVLELEVVRKKSGGNAQI